MEDVVSGMVSGLLPYGLAVLLGLVIAGLGGLLLVTGRRTHPALPSAGLAVVAFGGAVMAFLSLPADPTTPTALAGLQSAALIRGAGWMGSWVVGLAALVVLAAAGARKAPRDTTFAGLAFAGCMVVVLTTCVGGVMAGESGAGLFFYIRAGGYFLFGLLVTAAMLSGGEPEHPGHEAGAAAAVVFAQLVAISETSSRGVTVLLLCFNLPSVEEVATRPEIVRQYMALTDVEIPWLLITIAMAQVVGLIGLYSGARDGKTANWAAAVWLVLVPPVIWFVGAPSTEALVAAAEAMP